MQIGGPTGAFVILVAGVVGKFGYDGLAIATLMAGAFLIVMALARLGDVIRFTPYPVTVGFTSGIALIIAAGQLGDALGLEIQTLPPDLLARASTYANTIDTINLGAVAILVGTVVILRLWPKLETRVPAPLVALVVTTMIAHFLGLNVDTIHSRFGDIPRTLPSFRIPHCDPKMLSDLISPAISLALLASIESLLSAVVADGLSGGRHRSNAELFAQGVANIASPLFGGIPATGAIARTATNVRNGARTPIAGIIHAATLLIILLVAGPWASLVPMATLAGILLVVAYNMSEWHMFVRLLRGPRSDVLVLLTTFSLTVAIDLTVAIQVRVVLASLLFMRRMAEVTHVKKIEINDEYEALSEHSALDLPRNIEVFEINGSFCFGAARKFTETLIVSQGSPAVVILRMRHVLAMDATGLHALEDVVLRLRRRSTRLLLCEVQEQP